MSFVSRKIDDNDQLSTLTGKLIEGLRNVHFDQVSNINAALAIDMIEFQNSTAL